MELNESSYTGWLQILNWPQRVVYQLHQDALPPTFSNRDEYRVTHALCTLEMGADSCSPQKSRFANSILGIFKETLPAIQYHGAGGNSDEVEFAWSGNDYRILCGAALCRLQKQVAVVKSEWEQFLTGGILVGCASTPQEKQFLDATIFQDAASDSQIYEVPDIVQSQIKGLVFWANFDNYDDPKKRLEDCLINPYHKDKYPSYLSLVWMGFDENSCNNAQPKDAGFDFVLQYLLATGGSWFKFMANDKWVNWGQTCAMKDDGQLHCADTICIHLGASKVDKLIWSDSTSPGYPYPWNGTLWLIPDEKNKIIDLEIHNFKDLCTAHYRASL